MLRELGRTKELYGPENFKLIGSFTVLMTCCPRVANLCHARPRTLTTIICSRNQAVVAQWLVSVLSSHCSSH